ncbi:pantothenate transporter liz1 [Periconia macrospinosa]|uniref:Pantothenate transporter liz1 n=1 Tax=Periconia macrospinosa TaxID=97972 RepID=A0A2V1DSY5_9PLEO|nr:pantothenate transporter liz1 [Periconia macrospinosa]
MAPQFRERIRGFILGEEPKTKEERSLVQKIDFFILTFCCFAYFFNFLDRAAFANAYVAGLREALKMTGHDYNTVLAVTTAGMAVGQIPHGIIIQRIRPSVWLPSMVTVWAALTMASAAVKTVHQLCVLRFFLGLAEASTYSGAMYILGSWYKPLEIGKRTAIFSAAGMAGTMFAGVMMVAIYKGMNGLGNLAGWQWVFLIDGIITLPIAIFGFLYFPDIPEITKAGYLSEQEKKIASTRLPPIKADGHNIRPWPLAKRVLATKQFWILFFWSPVCATLEIYSVQNTFLLWLKYHSSHFTQPQINTYPLGVQAVGIISNMIAAWHMDVTNTRVPMAVLAVFLQLIVASMLLTRDLPFVGTFFAFYLSGTAYMVLPLIFGWANVILQRSGDDAVRSVTLYCMNIGSMVLYTFWGVVLYSAADAPYWKKGGIAMVVCCFVMLGYIYLVWKLDKDTLDKFGGGGGAGAEDDAEMSPASSAEKDTKGEELVATAIKEMAPSKV